MRVLISLDALGGKYQDTSVDIRNFEIINRGDVRSVDKISVYEYLKIRKFLNEHVSLWYKGHAPEVLDYDKSVIDVYEKLFREVEIKSREYVGIYFDDYINCWVEKSGNDLRVVLPDELPFSVFLGNQVYRRFPEKHPALVSAEYLAKNMKHDVHVYQLVEVFRGNQ